MPLFLRSSSSTSSVFHSLSTVCSLYFPCTAFVPLSLSPPTPHPSVGSFFFFPFSAVLSSLQRRVPCTNRMTGQPQSTLSLLEPDRPNVDLYTSLSSKTVLKIKLAISRGRPGQIMYSCKHGEPKHLNFLGKKAPHSAHVITVTSAAPVSNIITFTGKKNTQTEYRCYFAEDEYMDVR